MSTHQSARASYDEAGSPEPMNGEPMIDRIAVRDRREVVVLQVESIDWIRAADNYVEIHAGGRVHLLRGPLCELERRLDPRRFARIHRGVVVNRDRIDRLRTRPGGDPEALLRDGTRLPVGRSYALRVLAQWKGLRP